MNSRTEYNTRRSHKQHLVEELESDYLCPPSWADGAVRNPFRKVTDRFCCVIFFAFLIILIGTSLYAHIKADKKGIRRVYDSTGNICGEGAAADYPILYMQTFSSPYKSVCVKKCPYFDYNEMKNGNKNEPPLNAFDFNLKYAGLSHTSNLDITEKEAFEYNEEWANGYFNEQQWNTYLRNYNVECLPNREFSNCKQSDKFSIYDSYPVSDMFCAPLAPKAGLMFNRVESHFNNGDVGDLLFAMPLFGYCALVALLASILFLLVIACCPKLLTWLIFLTTGLLLIAGGIVMIISIRFTGPLNDSINPLRVKYLQYFIEHKTLLTIFGVVLIFLGLLVLFMMIKHRKWISAAVPLIKIASRSTLKNPLLFILSVLIIGLQLLVFYVELRTILKIYSLGDQTRDSAPGSPFIYYKQDLLHKIMIGIHCFGVYWLLVVLNNFNDFVCSAVAVNFYWTSKIENLRIICHTLGHSIGSIAWSIVILPALLVKIVFGWLDFLTSSNNPNCIQKTIRGVLCPCCWIYENFIDIISESSFSLIYLGSINFWPANKHYYYLSEKYIDLSSTITFAGILFQIISKSLIVLGTTSFCYGMYKSSIKYQQNIDNIGLLIFVAGLMGFFVGSLFVNLFSTTYDAMVTCFLVETNIQETTGRAVSNCPGEVKTVLEDLRRENNQNYQPL